MHDTLGHRLTVSIVQLEGAERLIPQQPERAAKKVGTVRQQLEEGLGELRQTVAMLRTPIATDLSLPRALKQLARDFERATQLHVQVSVPDSIPPLPDSYRMALYRAAQEALTNVQRHAQAKNISLALTVSPQNVTLQVTDDGIGIVSEEEVYGFGIQGIRERASQLEGTVKIMPTPEQGTRLVVQLPRSGEDSNGAN
jgi:signal transduction histidine kinase